MLYKSDHHHHHQHHHHQATATCLCFSSMRPLLNTCANVLVPVLILQDLLMSRFQQQVLHVRLWTDATLICMSLGRSSRGNTAVFGQKSVTTTCLCFGQRITATWLCWDKGHDDVCVGTKGHSNVSVFGHQLITTSCPYFSSMY